MDNFKQLIKEALTPEFLKESVTEAKFSKDDRVRTTGGVDFGDETFTVISQKGNKVTVEDDEDEIIIFKASKLELAESVNEVVGLGDSQPKDDDEDPDDRPAHEAGSFANNEEIELSSLVDKDRMKDAAMEGTMEGLVGLVHEMMDNSAKIERTLRGDFDLHYILRDLKMDLKSLNHKLSVVKEKLSL